MKQLAGSTIQMLSLQLPAVQIPLLLVQSMEVPMTDIDSNLLELIDLIYAAAVDDAGWHTFLERFSELHGFAGAWFGVMHADHDLSVALRQDPASAAAYTEHYRSVDPFVDAVLGAPRMVGLNEDRITRTDLVRTEYYQDFCRRFNVGDGIAIIARSASEGPVVALRAYRDFEGRRASPEDRKLGHVLLPHIRRAALIREQMLEARSTKASYAAVLERLSAAAFLVGEDLRLRWSNRKGESLLATNGLLKLQRGRFGTPRPSWTDGLRKLLQDAVDTSLGKGLAAGGGLRLCANPPDSDLLLIVSPVHSESSPWRQHRGLAVLFVIEILGSAQPATAELCRQIYALTPQEARLAALIAAGRSLHEASTLLGKSQETARSQLKAIFGKVGVNSQVELAATLAPLHLFEFHP